MNKVGYIIREIVARKKIRQRTSPEVDGRLPFQVALQAYRVAPAGRQLCRVQYRRFPSTGEVGRWISVTRLAGDASIKKRLHAEMVSRARERWLHARGVTVKAARIHLQGKGHFFHIE
jgi:hypothetical protein